MTRSKRQPWAGHAPRAEIVAAKVAEHCPTLHPNLSRLAARRIDRILFASKTCPAFAKVGRRRQFTQEFERRVLFSKQCRLPSIPLSFERLQRFFLHAAHSLRPVSDLVKPECGYRRAQLI